MGWPEEILKGRAERRAAELVKRLRRLETQFEKIKNELETARSANGRAETYRPVIDSKLQCPECWIQGEQESELAKNTSDDERRVETYWCRGCKKSFSLEW
jgi:Pyruvate/2-oxoacid:ferredoxin oxidoreductase delta subunit